MEVEAEVVGWWRWWWWQWQWQPVTCMSSCIEWTSQMQTVGIPIIPFFRLSGFTCPVAT